MHHYFIPCTFCRWDVPQYADARHCLVQTGYLQPVVLQIQNVVITQYVQPVEEVLILHTVEILANMTYNLGNGTFNSTYSGYNGTLSSGNGTANGTMSGMANSTSNGTVTGGNSPTYPQAYNYSAAAFYL